MISKIVACCLSKSSLFNITFFRTPLPYICQALLCFFKALPYSCLLNFPLPFFVDFFSLEIHAIRSIKNVYNNSKRRFSQTLKRRSHKMLICKLFKNAVTNNHLLTTITFKEIKHYIKPASRTSTTFQARRHKKKTLGMTFICFIVVRYHLFFRLFYLHCWSRTVWWSALFMNQAPVILSLLKLKLKLVFHWEHPFEHEQY